MKLIKGDRVKVILDTDNEDNLIEEAVFLYNGKSFEVESVTSNLWDFEEVLKMNQDEFFVEFAYNEITKL